MTALCALVLADRGELDLGAPVAKYWPEFAAAGKSEIRVRQALDYTSGMAGWTEAMTLNDGHGNGYGIAAVQSVLANGGAFGKRLMSEAGRERVLERRVDGPDVVLDVPIRWGLGYSISSEFLPGGTSGSRVAFWAGNGGSMSWVDLDHRMSFGYAPNRWITGPHENDRSLSILKALYECLAR